MKKEKWIQIVVEILRFLLAILAGGAAGTLM